MSKFKSILAAAKDTTEVEPAEIEPTQTEVEAVEVKKRWGRGGAN